MPSFVEIGSGAYLSDYQGEAMVFEGFLAYMGVTAILSCDHDAVNKLFPYTVRLRIKFAFHWHIGVAVILVM